MDMLENKFNEWRLLLEKYKGPELENVLWQMGCVIAQRDHARLFPVVAQELAEKIKSGEVKFPAPEPIDLDALISECDGIMIDGHIANFVDTDSPDTAIIVVEGGLWFVFYKTDLAKMPLGLWEAKVKSTEGVEHSLMFYKRVPVERDDLPG